MAEQVSDGNTSAGKGYIFLKKAFLVKDSPWKLPSNL